MKNIIEASQLPEQDKVYLKKDLFGWRTVEPHKIDGKIQWMNILFGGKRGLATLIFLMIVVGLLYIGVTDLISSYQTIATNPCDFCMEGSLN